MMSAEIVPFIHKIECAAYKVLVSQLISPIPHPKIYGMRDEPPFLIVMEDLGTNGGFVKVKT